MNRPTVLVASSGVDRGNWAPVVELLRGSCNVMVYEADRVASGEVSMSITVSPENGVSLSYDGRRLLPKDVSAGWFRRPTLFESQISDKALEYALDTERRMLQNGFWALVPEQAWLTAPKALREAEFKLRQLEVARSVGFIVPRTVVSNDWEIVRGRLGADMVYKPTYGTLYRDNTMELLYATRLPNDDQLPLEQNPFPGIWQDYARKAREWRVTVVGQTVFAAAIYTSHAAKDDWRAHQLDGEQVRFERADFPDAEAAKCLAYMEHFELGFGAFDFVEDHDGTIAFLECNANGQYGWLEEGLGFDVSRAIAELLLDRALAVA